MKYKKLTVPVNYEITAVMEVYLPAHLSDEAAIDTFIRNDHFPLPDGESVCGTESYWWDAAEIEEVNVDRKELKGKNVIKGSTRPLVATDIEWDIDEDEEVNLPNTIRIPDSITDIEEIGDYITNQTGYCHFGFKVTRSAKR